MAICTLIAKVLKFLFFNEFSKAIAILLFDSELDCINIL